MLPAASEGGGVPRDATTGSRAAQHQGRQLRVKRAVDLRDDAPRHLVELRAAPDLVDDAVQNTLRVVSLAEEAAVERLQPSRLSQVQPVRRKRQPDVQPAALAHGHDEGLIAVREQIDEERDADERSQRREDAAGRGILQSEPHHDRDVEHAMPQDRVRRANGREDHRQWDDQGQVLPVFRPGLFDRLPGKREEHQGGGARGGDCETEHENVHAAAIVWTREPQIVPQQAHHRCRQIDGSGHDRDAYQ